MKLFSAVRLLYRGWVCKHFHGGVINWSGDTYECPRCGQHWCFPMPATPKSGVTVTK